MKKMLILLCATSLLQPLFAQQATVTETVETVKTYPFSDPDPVADPSDLFYPYFRFDGFSAKGTDRQWKVVSLENDYIKLTLFPEIGGKIWGAVDKTTGKEFIYNNHVVKFRDIAMRGPWTSGGIEFNFGIIGHAPTSSTPVDYVTRQKPDGSVSCYVSSYELVTRTLWTVEVNLPKDKAYFTTTTTWHNSSSIDQPYYQWMNAGYPAAGNVEFCYPGTNYIGHGGELHSFPLDEQGRDISWYEKNDFGNSKSYHIVGKYNDFYGAYWHDNDFGSIHHADYDEKLGMKIFLWGLSREGGIWEDLLTDTNGQYIELQSGRMYNQPASNSSLTPYKHTAFGPQATDRWTEYWFPVKGIKGVSKASRIGALNVLREDGFLKLYFSPLQKLSTTIKLYEGEKEMNSIPLNCGVLETWKDSIPLNKAVAAGRLKVVVGEDLLVYSEVPSDNITSRPKQLPADFDWSSAYGLYTQGEQWMNQKVLDKAEKFLLASLEKDPYFVPALTDLASLYYRQGRYDEALARCETALSINTYDGDVNYLYGLCNMALGNHTDAKDGFSVASYSPGVRSAAYEKLAEMYLMDRNWTKAEHYALRSKEFNQMNLSADHVLMVVYRKTNQPEKAKALIDPLLEDLPLYHAARFEQLYQGEGSGHPIDDLQSLIRNELPFETYMELAEWYESVGCTEEALSLLSCAGNYPIALYKQAYLLHQAGNDDESRGMLQRAGALSPAMVFPFRPSSLKALEWAKTVQPDWKIDYYEALIRWANQDKAKALELLENCGEADYAPFYLSRASLKEGESRLADLLKAEQIEMSWRTGFALINHYVANNQWQKAVETGKKYTKKYPSNYYIGLKYAKALCETGQYQPCISLLSRMQVLPNEGSYAGRAVYREANLYRAMEQLSHKNYKQVVKSVETSKEWPENLGVGKPYDNMIDNRLEDYLEAKAAAGQGDSRKTSALLAAVADYTISRSHFESGNLLSALALRESGKVQEADHMVAAWSTDFPENRVVQWCTAIYRGEKEKAVGMLQSRNDQTNTTPWEASFRDSNFDLIVRLFSTEQ
ncbi:DUF5107 domain-containing protein [Parabacteroides merdae]|jgi:tetratricopeptide (TPR) repeat protein|uniref:DUF5107 domain-containing protein n=3 Tax=Parabacteroides merdae TaxID=46503 RepID=A0A412M839_9BACT|nr:MULTISPECIES: DUF5107 domain-containing protein [Parabacteroides]MBT9637324.1 DUF5107 domain-containing protein [Parabacteroides merdae]MBU9001238.1 DUF5107 domain-containing protein [Parabacteroides sp. MSK.9.14]MCB6303963.1 DUF5107 domain-containing protein [Parabacteroides merdae]MCG4890156.1 DUF5107 domain-containing protein [Parabacteroides merdae]MCG4934838.1 DUF5107 domain-containing protein [Parabacteroides merdae]